jgi:hypothetical protein
MSTNWKNIKVKGNGKFYESSKEEIEGWVKIETEEHGFRWHKEFTTIEGKLTKIETDDSGKYGDRIKIYIETGEDEVSVLELKLFTVTGHMEGYASSLSRIIDGVKIGSNIEIFCNRKKKNAKGNLYRNIFVNQQLEGEDEKGDPLPFNMVKPTITKEDIPEWEQIPNPVKKKEMIWDSSKQAAFFYERLEKYTENGSDYNNTSTEGIKEDIAKVPVETKKEHKEPAEVVVEEEDDLPF